MPDNTAPLPLPMPYSTLLQGLIKDSLWASLCGWILIVSHPKERLDHWNQIENLTQTYQAATIRIETRAETQIKQVQDACQTIMANDLTLSEKNRVNIEKNQELLLELKRLMDRSHERTP